MPIPSRAPDAVTETVETMNPGADDPEGRAACCDGLRIVGKGTDQRVGDRKAEHRSCCHDYAGHS